MITSKHETRQLNKERLSKLDDLLFNELIDRITLRPEQENVMEWIKKPIEAGKKFIVMQLPCGSGKSIIGQYFIKYYMNEVNPKAKFDLITNSKILQEQYLKEFGYLNDLKGMSNYKCEKWGKDCEYGKLCNQTKNSGAQCSDCPHTMAQESYIDGTISVTNFHILGLHTLFGKKLIEKRKPDVLIIDECHLFEEVINGFLTITLTKRHLDKYVVMEDAKKVSLMSSFEDIADLDEMALWLHNTLKPLLADSLAHHSKGLSRLSGKKLEEAIAITKSLSEFTQNLSRFISNHASKTGNYVGDRKTIKGDITWEIQPLWTGEMIRNKIFASYDHVVLMSGTIIDREIFAYLNGIKPSEIGYYEIPSPFPVENRLIYYYPNGRMTYNNKVEAWKEYVPAINNILRKYKGKKGIIHTNSYELFNWLRSDIDDDRLIFATPERRELALREHIEREDDCVLVSPSMTEGVDLHDDLSRFQVILKIPYPNLSSKVFKQRLQTKPEWYTMKTLQTLFQSYGRSIRSKDDHADTFILDSCFGDLLVKSGHLFPAEIMAAIRKLNKR
jgi:ATP-dependent DNA helicase DinG